MLRSNLKKVISARRPRRLWAGMILAATLAALLMLLAPVVSAAGHVITDRDVTVGADGDWNGEVGPADYQNWNFELQAPRSQHTIEINILAAGNLTLSVDGHVLGSVTDYGVFAVALDAGPHQVTVSNSGSFPVRYDLYMGSPIEDLLNALITALGGHNDAVLAGQAALGGGITGLGTALGNHNNAVLGGLDALGTALGNHNNAVITGLTAVGTALGTAIDDHNTAVLAILVGGLQGVGTALGDALANHETSMGAQHLALGAVLGAHDANIDSDLVDHDDNLSSRADDLDAALEVLRAKLDIETEMKRVHLQVIRMEAPKGKGDKDDDDDDDDDDKNKRTLRFLITTTEAGEPVNPEVVSVFVAVDDKKKPAAFVDVTSDTTVTTLRLGIHELVIELPKDLKKAAVFEFIVRHEDGTVPLLSEDPITHWGHIVVHDNGHDEDNNNNLGAGQ